MSIVSSNKSPVVIREILRNDIHELHQIRVSVKENTLSNPALITEADYIHYITTKGKGWLAEIDRKPVGFAIIDCIGQNVWALFVRPGYDKIGIGKKLHDVMLDWYFSRYDKELWLGTAPNTRAEDFYKIAGWKENGKHGNETRFTMSYSDWKNPNKKLSN